MTQPIVCRLRIPALTYQCLVLGLQHYVTNDATRTCLTLRNHSFARSTYHTGLGLTLTEIRRILGLIKTAKRYSRHYRLAVPELYRARLRDTMLIALRTQMFPNSSMRDCICRLYYKLNSEMHPLTWLANQAV